MKKLYLLFLTAVTGISFSQNILLSTPTSNSNGLLSPTNTLVNNDTIYYCVDDLYYTFEDGKVLVINNTASPMNIKVKRFGDQNMCFNSNQFCWTICYNPATSVSPDYINITGQDTSNAFHGWLTPSGTEGCCFIKYRFFNEADTNDYADVTIKYCFSGACALTLGDEDIKGSNAVSLYPNPASDFLSTEFGLLTNGGTITLTDITGKVVKTLIVASNSTKQVINLDGLKDGIYIYTLTGNNQTIATKKIVIKK